MNFSDKIVIVTGAGSGIGKAIAFRFAALSASLTLVSIDSDRLNKVAEECKKLNNNKVLTLAYDLSNKENIKNVVNHTKNMFGKIDVLINSAGKTSNVYVTSEGVLNDLEDILNVNLKAAIALTHYAVNTLIESKGCLINISSMMATVSGKGMIPYNVSKAALTHFTKCAALELAEEGVRVVSISPGSVKTNILSNYFQNSDDCSKYWEYLRLKKPLKHLTESEEIAELAAFLASDKARSITGIDVVADSGMSLAKYD